MVFLFGGRCPHAEKLMLSKYLPAVLGVADLYFPGGFQRSAKKVVHAHYAKVNT